MLGADETLADGVEQTARAFQEETDLHWRQWTRRLALPPEWQDAVIRAAITLKLCTFEETGAIIAAMTTSIPEAPASGRNWDYRYCWLRDAFFVVRALNSLSEVDTMEHYMRYLANVVGNAPDGHLQPVYGVALERRLEEHEIPGLAGYRGMGPVRVGNQAYEHLQHDVYGNVDSGHDPGLLRPPPAAAGDDAGFHAARARRRAGLSRHATPDASMWELRTRERVHTTSALMCWAACDRLARIAVRLQRPERAASVADARRRDPRGDREPAPGMRAQQLHGQLRRFGRRGGAAADGGSRVPARERSAFRRHGGGNRAAAAPRPASVPLRAADDFGLPTTAFNICTFWYIDALARIGRRDEARELFGHMLACRNHLGLLSEDTDPETGEAWGNYPQTYSLVGIINAATRLSEGWDTLV